MKEVRICELCHSVNEANSMECVHCGEDLAYVPVTTIEQPSTQPTNYKKTMVLSESQLHNPIDGKTITIPLEGCILGRDGNVDVKYFQQFPFISNHHASFKYECDQLIIQDLNSTNGTKVNGQKIVANTPTTLQTGDQIIMANIEFIVQ